MVYYPPAMAARRNTAPPGTGKKPVTVYSIPDFAQAVPMAYSPPSMGASRNTGPPVA
jgi:hypothetical protein